MRSSLVLLVPEADPVVHDVRLVHDPAAAAGILSHVTLLFPFVPADQLDAAVLDRVRAQVAGTGPIDMRFDRTARFPGVAYLALADPAPVLQLIATLAAEWPAYPLYGGLHAEVVPHLTIGHGTEATLDMIEAVVAPQLPIASRAREVTVLVEDAGRWQTHARLPLA